MPQNWHRNGVAFLLIAGLLAAATPLAAGRVRLRPGGGTVPALQHDSDQVWKEVQAWQQQHGQYAIVMVVRTDEDSGRAVMANLTGEPTGLTEFLAVATFVFMSREAIGNHFNDLPAGDGVVLVDPQGQKVASAPFDVSALSSTEKLAAAWRQLLAEGDATWFESLRKAA